jgi:TonB family protein
MPSSTTKESNAVPSASQKIGQPGAASGMHGEDTAGRSQPVALEVPVTVNGARAVEGSDKREPFSESTQTVLVFGNGAVIRLASTVAPGQLLFLTNDKTKKEVVCQVVKSKNYRSVSGYVELEFTEAIGGFWGMRFPGERASAPSGAPASTAKVPAPTANNTPRPTETRPAPSSTATKHAAPNLPQVKVDSAAPSKSETHPPALLNPLRASETQTVQTPFKVTMPSAPQAGPAKSPERTLQTKATMPAATQSSGLHTSAEALRLESARLQEQLSSLVWAAPAAPGVTQPTSAASTNKATTSDPSTNVLEISKKDPARTGAVQTAKNSGLRMESALDVEEVKIPSWLEPLARNAALPTQSELPPKSEAAPEQKAEKFELQEVASAARGEELEPAKLPEPVFDEALTSGSTIESRRAFATNKGMLIGAIAAGALILIAGGSWLLRRSSSAAPGTAAAAVTPAPAVNGASQPMTQNGAAPISTQGSSSASVAAGTSPAQVSTASSASSAQPVSVKSASNPNSELLAYKQLAEPGPTPKKPALGQVRLATPTIARNVRTPEPADTGTAPLIDNQLTPNVDGLTNGLAAAKQPLAPPAALQTGGDVKPARMISSIAPVYPMLAKNQHVEGDIRIDALIEPTGRVSAMKVVSGPPLLQQAAMDALRQWKYQPATLDGKPVPMHLTVTIQFRMK